MQRWRDADGQATSEYVGLVTVVAVVLALAAGLTTGGVGGEVLAVMQRALCRVAGAACERPRASADELKPCPVERTTSSESLEGAFDVVRLAGGGSLTAERGSDGRVTVTLAGTRTGGAELGIGYRAALGGRHGEEATARAEISRASGRSWILPSPAAARAFVDRYGSKATVVGKAVDLARSGCSILCDAIGWRPHAELPPPDEEYLGYGAAAKLAASLGPASLSASAGGLLGARLRRDGSSTWFVQLDAAAGAELALGIDTVGIGGQLQTVLDYTLDARHRPTELGLHTVVATEGKGSLQGQRARMTAALEGGGARVTELDATLDLRDARNHAAFDAFVAALSDPLAAPSLLRSAAAMRMRIAQSGVVDRRTYAQSSSTFELGGKVGLGAQLGGSFASTQEGMRLLSAETRLPGLPFLPRDDCRAA